MLKLFAGAAGAAALVSATQRGSELVLQHDADKLLLEQKNEALSKHNEELSMALVSKEWDGVRERLIFGSVAITFAAAGYITLAATIAHQHAHIMSNVWPGLLSIVRRHEVAQATAKRFGGQELATSLLPLLDGSTRAYHDELYGVLKAHGVERFDPKLGAPFDAATMEVLTESGATDGFDESKCTVPNAIVAAVLRPGYIHHGERVLRPAHVETTNPAS